ncbi:MAG: hypothetical protein PHC68_00430 [Syntrophorhabdaceae bacterium]|nr:hypothetical protein [Syntrophorhabdaceae bacterium]
MRFFEGLDFGLSQLWSEISHDNFYWLGRDFGPAILITLISIIAVIGLTILLERRTK